MISILLLVKILVWGATGVCVLDFIRQLTGRYKLDTFTIIILILLGFASGLMFLL